MTIIKKCACVCVLHVTVFKDEKTPYPFVEDFSNLGDVTGEAQRSAKPDHIYMDCMGFGMGCCCLQVTFQACNITEARALYDQLAPICPIMVSLLLKLWMLFKALLNQPYLSQACCKQLAWSACWDPLNQCSATVLCVCYAILCYLSNIRDLAEPNVPVTEILVYLSVLVTVT